MYAITVKQPWAWFVIHGGRNRKDVENRSWACRPGRYLVHAGTGFDDEAFDFIREWVGAKIPRAALQGGKIIGSVEVVSVEKGGRRQHDSIWAFAGSPYWWNLDKPVAADPEIPCRGYPALWNPPATWKRSFMKAVT